MAVCKEESLLCIFERYLAMKKIMGMGRFTTIEAHNKRYEQFPKTARNQMNKGVNIEIYERTLDRTSPKLIYSSFDTNNKISMEQALNDGRVRSFKECMKTAKYRLEVINKDMKELVDVNNKKMYEQLDMLNNILNQSLSLYEEKERI